MAIIRMPKKKPEPTDLERLQAGSRMGLESAQRTAMGIQAVKGVLQATDLAMGNKFLNAAGKRVAGLFDSEPTREEISAAFNPMRSAEDVSTPPLDLYQRPVATPEAGTAREAAVQSLMPRPYFDDAGQPTQAAPAMPSASAAAAAMPSPQGAVDATRLLSPQGAVDARPASLPPLRTQEPGAAPASDIATQASQSASVFTRQPREGQSQEILSTTREQGDVLDELNRIVSAGPYEVEAPAGLDLKGRLALARQLLSESSAARPLPPDSYLEIAPTNALIRLGASPRSEEDMARLEFYLRARARAGEIMSAPGGQASAGPGFIEEAIGGGAASRASAMLNALQHKTTSGMKEQDVWKVAEVLAKTANYDASTVKRLSSAHKDAAKILEIEEGLGSKNTLRLAQAYKALANPALWAARVNLYNRTKARRKGASRRTKKIATFDWSTVKTGANAHLNNTTPYKPNLENNFKAITGPNGEVLTVYGAITKLKLNDEYTDHVKMAQGAGRLAQATANAAAAERRHRTAMAKAGSERRPQKLTTKFNMAKKAWEGKLASANTQMTQSNYVMPITLGELSAAADAYLAAADAFDEWDKENPVGGTAPAQPEAPARAGSPPIVDPDSTTVGP